MNMNSCHVMKKAEAMASGAGVGVCRSFGAGLSGSGRRRELSTPGFRGRNSTVRVECGNAAGLGIRAREARSLACRAIGGGKNLYQPFRPPISIETPAGATTAAEQLEILRERRGLWHEYAGVIPLLARSGYTPSAIDEETGMTGVEQNIIAVASQVRNSLKASGFSEDNLRHFDIGGGELLYELRILSATQRKASAEFIVERRMSPKEACELARSVKDFGRRKNSEGLSNFTSAPGDCLAFAFYRQSRECGDGEEAEALLHKALEVCVSEKARAKIEETLRKCPEADAAEPEGAGSVAHLQVIRLLEGEVVGTTLPTMVPVAEATLESVEAVPALPAQGEGQFNVFATAGWASWVALPGWHPVVHAGAPVAVHFPDAAKLPLQSNVNGKARLREPTLVIIDKSVSAVDDDDGPCLYAVATTQGGGSQALSLVPASKVLDNVLVVGRVILALRPPTPPSQDPVDWD